MGLHDYLDVAGWVVLGSVTLIAVVLGARLTRHDAEISAERAERKDHGEKLQFIEGLLRGAGIWK